MNQEFGSCIHVHILLNGNGFRVVLVATLLEAFVQHSCEGALAKPNEEFNDRPVDIEHHSANDEIADIVVPS